MSRYTDTELAFATTLDSEVAAGMFAEADHDGRADMMISAAAAAALSMPSDSELQMALEFADAHDAAGNYDDAEAAVAEYGIELAGPADWATVDAIGMAAMAAAAGPAPRRDEDRVSWLIGQIGDGSCMAGGSGYTGSGWPGEPATLSESGNCGSSDEFGYCREPFHQVGCGSMIGSADEAQGLRPAMERGSQAAAVDADGRSWSTRDGRAATMTDLLEQRTGQRLRSGPSGIFEPGPGGRREVDSLRPQMIDKDDPSDPDDHGRDVPAGDATQALAQRILAQTGLASSAPADRARAVAEHDHRLAGQAMRTSRAWHPDSSGDMRSRREAHRRPVQLVQSGDNWNGRIAGYTAAAPAAEEELWL
jgi:hypothetical protein